MPTQHDPEAEIRATVHALLRAWMQTDANRIDDFLARVADDFAGFGTGPEDYYAGRDALRALTLREHEQMAYPYTLEVSWLAVRMLRPTLALADGEIRLEVDAGAETIVIVPRFSFVLERRGEAWPLVHFHFSVPDTMLDPGGTLGGALEARNRELERLVAQRTTELEQSLASLRAAQAQLVQQEKLASLGALTAGIAHEIKNPLNFVTNFATLSGELVDELAEALGGALDGEAAAEDVRDLLADLKTSTEKIEEHGRRADGIVRSMLEHSRSSDGERRRVDLNALVEEYVGLAWHGQRARALDARVEVTTDLGAEVGEVDVAPREIGRVLLNLLGNAFDAVEERAATAPQGAGAREEPSQRRAPYRPRVAVTTRRVDERVEIRVADNGPGIPEAVRERVFDPFFTTKPTGSGTGLGLSLSYDIVTQGHGGTLTLTSEEGEGATFVVSLPAPAGPRDAVP